MKRRRWPFWVIAGLGALLLANAAAWLVAERELDRGIARWTAALASQGIAVRADPVSRGGFPIVASRSLAVRLRLGTASLDTARLILVVSPTAPDRVLVRLPVPVRVTLPALPQMAFAAPDWRVQAFLDGTGLVTLDAHDLTARFAAPDGTPLEGSAALVHLQLQGAGTSTDLVGSAQSVTLPEPPPGEAFPLGRHLASIAWELLLSGYMPPPTAGRAWPDAAALGTWRDHGGAVVLKRLALGYGPLGVSGHGRVTLDAALQPQGEASLTLLGYADTLDALVQGRVLSAHAAQAIAAVLGLLARPPAGGGVSEVALDLQVQGRVLNAAGFPLLRLPPVDWPPGGG